MDFRLVSEFFGGSIFPEEYRADYKDTDQKIKALESTISVSSSVWEKAFVLILRTVHSAMSGDFTRADEYLCQISRLSDSDFGVYWPFRRSAYELYVSCLKRVTPTLRFWTGRSDASGILRDYQLEIQVKRMLQIEQRTLMRSQVQNELEKLEFNVIYDLADFHVKLWMQAFEHHPQYPERTMGMLFEGTEPCSHDTIALSEKLGLHKTSAALKRLAAQYLLAGFSESATSVLSELNDSYVQDDDVVGEANVKLMQGDSHLSPPFTSPMALNLMPHGRNLGWGNNAWDAQESEVPLRRSQLATSSYADAYYLFEAANAKGGMGAVLLRRACVDHAEAIEARRVGDLGIAAQLLDLARKSLEEAQGLFQGDHTHSLIVLGHLLILDISSGHHTNVLTQAYELGASCKDTDNIGVLQFIGTLLLRLGRKYSTFETEKTKVFLCCYCSQVCFHAAKDSYLELSAVVASAIFQRATGNFPAATKHIGHGRKLLKSVNDYIGTLIDRTANQDHRQILELVRANCVSEFNQSVTSVTSFNSDTNHRSRDQPDALSGPSAIESMLESLPVGPSLIAVRDALIGIEREIQSLRGVFREALTARRDSIRMHADVDMAEKILNVALGKIEAFSCPTPSSELELMKVVILSYLGEFERARQLVPLVVPHLFGGRRSGLPQDGVRSSNLVGFMTQHQKQDAQRSIAICFAAKEWELGATVLQHIEAVIPTFFDDIRHSSDSDSWYEMVQIAYIHEHAGRLGSAFQWYMEAFRVAEGHHSRLTDINDRRDLFNTLHSQELFFGLGRIALLFSESSDPDQLVGNLEQWHLTASEWLGQGLKFFELGHSRALLDLLIADKMTDHAQLKKLSDYSYRLKNDALSAATSVQRDQSGDTLCSDNDTRDEYLRKMEESLRFELDPLSLAKIVPELKLTAETNMELYKSIPTNAVVLHINISRDGSRILCISSDGIEHVHQVDITDLEMDRHVLRYLKLFRDVQISDLPPLSTCKNLVERISEILIKPISRFLKDRDHIIFVPSRSLNKFPYSALILDGQEIFLTKDISVCPSLSSLQHITDREVKFRKSVNVVFNNEADCKPLDISASAATAIARDFDTVPLPTNVISYDDFANIYEDSNIMLTTTHGKQHPTSAWQSSLVLKPPFRVLDLSRLRSKAALVIFSACVSGLGEETVGNDMLGFSHAVLSSGVSAFLGTLWNVGDEASALLMVYFFRAIKNAKSGVSIAGCWRIAQTQLYKADSQSAMATLMGIIKKCKKAEKQGFISSALSKRFRATLRDTIDGIKDDGAVYKHPFFWAPFILVGHGGVLSSVEDTTSSVEDGQEDQS